MMKLLKSLMMVIFLSLAPTCYAGGPLDGIYYCNISSPGLGSTNIYIAINSNSEITIISIPSLAGTPFSGYIWGSPASDTYFTGFSSYGYPFTASASGNAGSKSLSAQGAMYMEGLGAINGNAACNQVI